MATRDVAAALQRMESVLARRPEIAVHDDAPAEARWTGGTGMLACHANGTQIPSDMAVEAGGGGAYTTPGWLFRAGMASCTATTIAMHAALRGVELTSLRLLVSSRSDARGFLGMKGADGQTVSPAPVELTFLVRIAAVGVPEQVLRDLVDEGCRRSPALGVVGHAATITVHVET